jgi:prepilin-type N-terminal cleavage/methylation domain-containing protein
MSESQSAFSHFLSSRTSSLKPRASGYTLIEMMVAVGLFAIIMMLSSGAYLIMIGSNQRAQAMATGIDNLSFALETMTRNIRMGSSYNCGGIGDCVVPASSFSFKNESGVTVSYFLSGTTLQETVGSVTSSLTDASVTITSLSFFADGTRTLAQGDQQQAHVTMTVSGTVPTGIGKPPQAFTVETGATMRGTDI